MWTAKTLIRLDFDSCTGHFVGFVMRRLSYDLTRELDYLNFSKHVLFHSLETDRDKFSTLRMSQCAFCTSVASDLIYFKIVRTELNSTMYVLSAGIHGTLLGSISTPWTCPVITDISFSMTATEL